jgi:hypothetical protein
MTYSAHRSLVAVGSALLAWICGCAAPADSASEQDEESATIESAASTSPSATNIDLQRKVTTAFAVPLGLGTKALMLNHACTTGVPYAMTDLIDALMGLKQNLDEGYATLGEPSMTTILGLKAVKRPLRLSSSYRASINSPPLQLPAGLYIQRLQNYFVACWGDGVKPFVYLGSDGATGYFDPEPAKLTQSLSGSTGATAAAVYANSNTSTNVIKWSSTAAAGSAAGGTACSPGDLSVSSETLKVIQVLPNGYRKCL